MSRPVIFLDFDGILLSTAEYIKQKISHSAENTDNVMFDKEAVNYINSLIIDFDATIVLSTSWSCLGFDRCSAILENNGIDSKRLHKDWKTPKKLSSSRYLEIVLWLDDNPKYSQWLAIDDNWTIKWFAEKEASDHIVFVENKTPASVFSKVHFNEAYDKLSKKQSKFLNPCA